jgi:hypothetical protein
VTGRPETPPPGETGETAETAAVRRLLAEARHTEPMPVDVATRMEAALAGLSTERAPREHVVTIAPHRRRRVGALLVAAAAVVVGAVTLGPHLPSSPSSSERSASGGSAASENNLDAGSAPASSPAAGSSVAPHSTPASGRAQVHAGRVVVHDRRFASDALGARALLERSSTQSSGSTQDTETDLLRDCADVPRTSETLPATYQRAPAALVFRAPEGSTQVVDLYVCGNPDPIRSTTLQAP